MAYELGDRDSGRYLNEVTTQRQGINRRLDQHNNLTNTSWHCTATRPLSFYIFKHYRIWRMLWDFSSEACTLQHLQNITHGLTLSFVIPAVTAWTRDGWCALFLLLALSPFVQFKLLNWSTKKAILVDTTAANYTQRVLRSAISRNGNWKFVSAVKTRELWWTTVVETLSEFWNIESHRDDANLFSPKPVHETSSLILFCDTRLIPQSYVIITLHLRISNENLFFCLRLF